MPDVEMVSVFCHNGKGGNPTGLVLDAGAMSAEEMRQVAERCGHESGFVLPAPDTSADFRFRYFVPRHEMEMCGHATVGALWSPREGHVDPELLTRAFAGAARRRSASKPPSWRGQPHNASSMRTAA